MRFWTWLIFSLCSISLVAQSGAQSMASLEYSSYLGGSNTEIGVAMAVAANGSVYVIGNTNSFDFPHTISAFQSTYGGGGNDVFIAKFSSDLTTLDAATYLGGSGLDQAHDIIIQSNGDVVVSLSTRSEDMSLGNNPYKDTLTAGEELFLARFDADLTTMLSGSYIGRIFPDPNYGRTTLAAAGSGQFYVAGTTSDTLFPVKPAAAQDTLGGGADGFILLMDDNMSGIAAGTFLGGSDADFLTDIHFSGSSVWVTGKSQSLNWPVNGNWLQDTLAGGSDAILAKLSINLAALEHSTYFGGGAFDAATTLLEESNGDIVIGGLTYSDTLPTAGHVHKPYLTGALADIFMMRTNANISQLKTVTYYGGTNIDYLFDLAQFSNDQLLLAGETLSDDIPIQPNGFDTTWNGPSEGLLVRFTQPFDRLPESSYVGGTGYEQVNDVLVDGQDLVLAVGYTSSADFEVSGDAYQSERKGVADAFIIRTEMPATGITKPKADFEMTIHGSQLIVTGDRPIRGTVEIVAMDGGLVKEMQLTTSNRVSLPNITPGMYLVILKSEDGLETLKWVTN